MSEGMCGSGYVLQWDVGVRGMPSYHLGNGGLRGSEWVSTTRCFSNNLGE